MIEDLIFDVGAHNGSDTAYYLAKGYRVVAVEADHQLCEHMREGFAEELESGQLALAEVAVCERRGPVRLWRCEAVSEWNSLSESFPCAFGLRRRAAWVSGIRAEELLARFGVPYYMKIDIEGFDQYCVEAIRTDDAPQFVSMELNGIGDLLLLDRVGYTQFKLIHQGVSDRHRQFHSGGPLASGSRSAAGSSSVVRAESGRLQGDSLPGPSGPFGHETDGNWCTFEEAARDILSIAQRASALVDGLPWSVWFDLHATRGD